MLRQLRRYDLYTACRRLWSSGGEGSSVNRHRAPPRGRRRPSSCCFFSSRSSSSSLSSSPLLLPSLSLVLRPRTLSWLPLVVSSSTPPPPDDPGAALPRRGDTTTGETPRGGQRVLQDGSARPSRRSSRPDRELHVSSSATLSRPRRSLLLPLLPRWRALSASEPPLPAQPSSSASPPPTAATRQHVRAEGREKREERNSSLQGRTLTASEERLEQ